MLFLNWTSLDTKNIVNVFTAADFMPVQMDQSKLFLIFDPI